MTGAVIGSDSRVQYSWYISSESIGTAFKRPAACQSGPNKYSWRAPNRLRQKHRGLMAAMGARCCAAGCGGGAGIGDLIGALW